MTYSFSTNPLFVDEGDIIQFQYKAPDTWDTTETVTIQVGLLTQFWFITTIPEDFQPNPFPLNTVRNADLDTVYTYGDGTRPGENIITVSGLTPGTLVPVSLSANDFPSINRYSISINGGPFITLPDNTTVQNGSTIQLRARTFNAPAQTLRLNLSIGLGQETWELITKQTAANVPVPPPVFTPLTNLPLSFPVYSNIVVVQGLSSPGLVSAGFGTLVAASNSNISTTNANGYDVLNGVTFASSLTVSNGQYLQLLATSANSPNTQISVAVDIGDGIGISSWVITTGAAPSTTPINFTFPNISNVAPNTVIASASRPVGGITGLASGVSVPVELISTTGSEPRVKINNGSIGVFPTTVVNGDTITLYNRSADLGGNVETLIKVGERVISTWSIDTYLAPDSTPSFTQPPNLSNRVPDTFVSSAVIGLTDFNVPITITATNGALISIDYDTPSVGPRTFDPLVNSLIFLVIKTPNALSASIGTSVTIGSAAAFTWSVSTYAVAPPPPSNLGTWYSIKTRKYDGFSIGTVVQILKENSVTEYGNIQDRFPGFLECNGGSYAVAQYPDLWNVIGNTYGGSGDYDSTTKIYSGSFNVPDYRNKRLCGIGQVDQNFGGSSFLPVSSGGGINQVGSTGGFWFIDRSGIAGPLPLEQVFTGGTTSDFFSLGTVRTFGSENLVSEIEFTVDGFVNATLGKLGEVNVNVPTHEHLFWSSEGQDGGEPAIPWGKRAMYATGVSGVGLDENFGSGRIRDNLVDQVIQDDIEARLGTQFLSELSQTGLQIDDIYAPRGNQTTNFGNWWASPWSTLQSQAGGRLYDTGGSGANDAGVIDIDTATMRINPYISPGVTKRHSHLMSLDIATNPQTDFTLGNVNGVGSKYAASLPNANDTLAVTFNQNPTANDPISVLLELNPATFTFNSQIKPIPVVEMVPNKIVPLLTPFHKVKYIIKAY